GACTNAATRQSAVTILARIDGAVAARRRARAIRRARADACARGDAVALLRRLIDDVVAALRIDERRHAELARPERLDAVRLELIRDEHLTRTGDEARAEAHLVAHEAAARAGEARAVFFDPHDE